MITWGYQIMLMRDIVIRCLSVFIALFISGCSYIPWFGDDEEVQIEFRDPLE